MSECPNDPSNGYGSHNTTHPLPCPAPGCECATALRKDAERYRWLRANINGVRWDVLFDDCGRSPLDMEQLDTAIDAEMLRGPAVGAA